MKKLILIDGNAILHRAYHALPPLTNSKGEVVNAVYGFFSMLLNLLSTEKPDYLAICFDRSKPTIRQSMYAGYHEHRPPVDDALLSQLVILDDLLSQLRVPVYSLEGYEGDDLIGTIVSQVQKTFHPQRGRNLESPNFSKPDQSDPHKLKNGQSSEDIEVLIVTGDRDLLQLVSDKVKVLMTVTGITKTILYDEEKIKDKYGIKPSQFVDYKALIGDPSDGYPGVSGIGPKTAITLLQQYGTLEELYKHIGELPEKIGMKLAIDAEQGALAKKLATIMTDAPIHLNLASCEVKKFDLNKLKEGFRKQGFKSLVKRLDPKLIEQNISQEPRKAKDSNHQLNLL
jgi:DNA polymerase-1